MKTIFKSFLLISFLATVGCMPQNNAENADRSVASTGATSSGSAGGTPAIQTLTAPQVRVKNYNQYNMSLEKLTGISRANYTDLFESLKGSLPADGEIDGLTPFNLIAMSNLADAYCKAYVDREAVAGKPLYASLSPTLSVTGVRDFLFDQFLDADPADRSYDSLRAEIDNVLHNSDAQGIIFPNVTNNLAGYKTLTVAACVAILASPYVTLLE